LEVEDDESFVAGGVVSHNCRPSGAGSREDFKPKPEHIEICASLWLEAYIQMVKPRFIASLGAVSTQYLLGGQVKGKVNMGEMNGQPQTISRGGREIVVVPIYHPAAALRNTGLMRDVQEGFRVLREVVDGKWKRAEDEVGERVRYELAE
jgi:DNA polymerase